MGQLKVTAKQDGAGKLTFEFNGSIDEDSVFSDLKLSDCSEATLDLGSISAINSCGIREWMKWIRTAPQGSKLIFKNCSKVIVAQMNAVEGFLPKGSEVLSFFVPYYCESCDEVTSILFSAGKEFTDNKVQAPESAPCQKCKNPSEIDVVEKTYFKFIQG